MPVARMVKQSANWARQRNATTLIGHVKRSPLVQKALYKPLDGDQPRLTEQDAVFVRENLHSEIVRLEAMFDVELQHRWGWNVS